MDQRIALYKSYLLLLSSVILVSKLLISSAIAWKKRSLIQTCKFGCWSEVLIELKTIQNRPAVVSVPRCKLPLP